jgi:hypothetical protein
VAAAAAAATAGRRSLKNREIKEKREPPLGLSLRDAEGGVSRSEEY